MSNYLVVCEIGIIILDCDNKPILSKRHSGNPLYLTFRDITKGKLSQEINEILGSLNQSMGRSKIEKMRWWLKNGEMEEIVRMLLVDYYDPRYLNAMKRYKFSMEISTENLDYAVNMLRSFRNEIIENNKSLQIQ